MLLSKKLRRRGSSHAVPRQDVAEPGKNLGQTSARPRLSDELCTVAFAASRLKVHEKTILRFIRTGRLKATRIGKSYRLLRSDLENLAGVPLPAAPAETSVTSVVDVPEVTPETARQWSLAITNALNARTNRSPPFRAETIYEPEHARFKVVIIGAPGDTANLLGLIRILTGR